MAECLNIVLDGPEISSPETVTSQGWWCDGNVVNVRTATYLTRYSLPKGSRRIALERLHNGRQRLILGGFKSTTVTVCGPVATIEKLWRNVL